ncbi:MAG: thioredoxin fold domain-containing protein [Thiotrichaceae bacterium]|nr:thioredoxin fold domain-containing protein [Thiotrichaceae bacterium]
MKKIYLITLLFLFLCACSHFVLAAHSAHAGKTKLKQITDIRDTARQAEAENLPILMMFGTDQCPYCKLLKEDFLIPMIISGDYADKIILREVHISSQSGLMDFSGKKISSSEFARRYNVRLYPTMVFIDSNGQMLVENIIGITTPSLFGGTLDDQIDRAFSRLRKNHLLKKQELF